MKTWILILFVLLFGVISCDEDEKPPLDNSCSINNLDGECKDDKSCISGKCIYECGENLECPDSNYHCDNNICYNTTERCSSHNYFGKCSNETNTCVEGECKNLNPCSREFPTGICSSENRYCYNGICVETTSECKPWNITGFCPRDYYCSFGTCLHKKIQYPCLPQYLDGNCELESETCVNGQCLNTQDTCGEFSNYCPSGQDCSSGGCTVNENDICSLSFLFGYCEDEDDVCFNGECSSLKEDCSLENPFGACPKDSMCTIGACKAFFVECDEANNIFCPNLERQFCENNICIDKALFCEDGVVNGLCPENEACVNSECKLVTTECSLSNLNGLCNALNLNCINGECLDSSQENICSALNLRGECPIGQICEDGICNGITTQLDIGNNCIMDTECKSTLYCEKTFLDGYCTKICSEQADCTDSSICYKTSETNGYCLAKCSVNIPNSCDRNNTENYICYPENVNDGVCLYDCKYHGCFETGKICNQSTGICN